MDGRDCPAKFAQRDASGSTRDLSNRSASSGCVTDCANCWRRIVIGASNGCDSTTVRSGLDEFAGKSRPEVIGLSEEQPRASDEYAHNDDCCSFKVHARTSNTSRTQCQKTFTVCLAFSLCGGRCSCRLTTPEFGMQREPVSLCASTSVCFYAPRALSRACCTRLVDFPLILRTGTSPFSITRPLIFGPRIGSCCTSGNGSSSRTPSINWLRDVTGRPYFSKFDSFLASRSAILFAR